LRQAELEVCVEWPVKVVPGTFDGVIDRGSDRRAQSRNSCLDILARSTDPRDIERDETIDVPLHERCARESGNARASIGSDAERCCRASLRERMAAKVALTMTGDQKKSSGS